MAVRDRWQPGSEDGRQAGTLSGEFVRALRRRFRPVVGAVVLSVAALAAGGWYARAHYWLPRKHIETARQALARRDFSEARRELDCYLQTWPNDPRGHFLMARACRRAGDLNQAEEYLIRCEHLQGDRRDPQVGDSKLEWALLEVQRGKLIEMEPLLRHRIQKNDPDTILILETMSWELMRRNRLQDALVLVNRWLEQQPEEYEAHVRHGWVMEHLFDRDQAIKDYGKALELQPEHASVRLRRAELLVDQNKAEEALEEIAGLRARGAMDAEGTLCYARALRLKGRRQEAQKVLDELLATQPDDVSGLHLRATLATEAGRPEEALILLQKAAAREPLNYEVNYTLLECLHQLGKTHEARAIEARLAQSKEQVARLDRLIGEVMQKPYDPSLRHEIGMIFLQNGMARDGLHWLATALDADPNYRPTHEALAQYYERTGDPGRAAWHRQFLHRPGGEKY